MARTHPRSGRVRSVRPWSIAILSIGALLSPTSVGSAGAASSTSNWWWDTYEVQSVQDQGLTGKGVKVAVVDANINPHLPAFSGRSLTVDDRPLCAEATSPTSTETNSFTTHGSTIVASLIGNGQGGGNIRGIAPEADVTFYSLGTTVDDGQCSTPGYDDVLNVATIGIQRAVDDGAQIITTSVGADIGLLDEDAEVIANALAKGIIVVIATDNPGSDTVLSGLGSLNGVVVASAVDSKGDLQTKEDGKPFIRAATTVVAAGVSLPTLGSIDASWDDSDPASGSSFAAPLVAGMLAVVKQKYPDATSNQILQSLIRNTGRTDRPFSYEPASGYGYGPAWLTHMLQKDPSQYPDENPLMKSDRSGRPTAEQIAAASARGSVYPPETATEATPAPSDGPATASPPPPAPDAGPLIPILLIALGIILLAAIVTAVIIIVTRKKRGSS